MWVDRGMKWKVTQIFMQILTPGWAGGRGQDCENTVTRLNLNHHRSLSLSGSVGGASAEPHSQADGQKTDRASAVRSQRSAGSVEGVALFIFVVEHTIKQSEKKQIFLWFALLFAWIFLFSLICWQKEGGGGWCSHVCISSNTHTSADMQPIKYIVKYYPDTPCWERLLSSY